MKDESWTYVEHGDVKLKHHSTSSLVELTITTNEEIYRGEESEVETKVWMDYKTLDDLRAALSKTEPNMSTDDILSNMGWTVVCESPLTIEDGEGNHAVGLAAQYCIDGIIEDYKSQFLI